MGFGRREDDAARGGEGFLGLELGGGRGAEVEAEARRKVLEMGVVSWRCGNPRLGDGPLVRLSTGWVGP